MSIQLSRGGLYMGFMVSTMKSALQHRSVMRLINGTLAVMFFVSLMMSFNAGSNPVDAAVKTSCTSPNNGQVHQLTKESFQSANISVSGGTATATFKFPGYCEGQNVPITLVAYKSPNTSDNTPFSKQLYFSSVSRNFNEPRSDAQMSVDLPSCRYQVDLVMGSQSDIIRTFSDGHGSANTYSGQGRMITATGGNLGQPCLEIDPAPTPAPTPPPAPVAPTPPPAAAPAVTNTCVNNSCNTTTVTQVNESSTTVSNSPNTNVTTQQGNAASVSNGGSATAAVQQHAQSSVVAATPPPAAAPQPRPVVTTPIASGKGPQTLPETGAGMVAPFAFGVTFMSSMLASYRNRFPEMLAKLLARF